MMETRIESGMEMAMISVLRQLPRNSRIISAVRQAAIKPSRITPWIAARTKIDWSNSGVITSLRRQKDADLRQLGVDLRDDVQRRSAAGLVNRHQHAALAVHAHDIDLRREAVADAGDVAHINRRAIDWS